MYKKSIVTFLIFACLNLQASHPSFYTQNNEAVSDSQLHKAVMHSHINKWVAHGVFVDSLRSGQGGCSSKRKIYLLKSSLKRVEKALVKINNTENINRRLADKTNETELLLLGLKYSESNSEDFLKRSHEYDSLESYSQKKSTSSTSTDEELALDTRIETLKELVKNRLFSLEEEPSLTLDSKDSSESESTRK